MFNNYQKLTENEILNDFSVVRNNLKQQVNIPYDIFIIHTEEEIFYEKSKISLNKMSLT